MGSEPADRNRAGANEGRKSNYIRRGDKDFDAQLGELVPRAVEAIDCENAIIAFSHRLLMMSAAV